MGDDAHAAEEVRFLLRSVSKCASCREYSYSFVGEGNKAGEN